MSDRHSQIESRLVGIHGRIAQAALDAGRNPQEITLVVVTKTFPISDLEILYQLGERNFGENRIADGESKAGGLPKDVVWHFQGQIQSNKLKSLLSWADVIHSLDDFGHARKIQSLLPDGRSVDVYLQVRLDQRDDVSQRGGVWPDNLPQFVSEVANLNKLSIRGLMAVAPLDEEPEQSFARLEEIHRSVEDEFANSGLNLRGLSAGMSADFESAIRHGATLVRIGSSILGLR